MSTSSRRSTAGRGSRLIELSGLRLDLGEAIGREVQILTTPEKLRAWVQDSIARDTIEVF